jgi:hypothetical protein
MYVINKVTLSERHRLVFMRPSMPGYYSSLEVDGRYEKVSGLWLWKSKWFVIAPYIVDVRKTFIFEIYHKKVDNETCLSIWWTSMAANSYLLPWPSESKLERRNFKKLVIFYREFVLWCEDEELLFFHGFDNVRQLK